MKAKTHFLTLIPLYILLFFSFFIVIIFGHHLEGNYYKKLSDMPILVYAYNNSQLNALKDNLDQNPAVLKTEIQPAETLKKNMIEKYNLANDELVQNSKLPDLLIINFKGDKKIAYLKILQQVRNNHPDFLLDYNIKAVDELFAGLEQFIALRSYLIYFLLGLYVIIMFYTRSFYEIANMEYWKIFMRAGGDISRRHKNFFIHSAILYFTGPLLSLIAALYAGNQFFGQSGPINEPAVELLVNPLILMVISSPIVADLLCFFYLRRKI